MNKVKYIILIILIYTNITEAGRDREYSELELGRFIPIKTIGLHQATITEIDNINFFEVWKDYNEFISSLLNKKYRLDEKTFIELLISLYNKIKKTEFIISRLRDIEKYPKYFQVTIDWGVVDINFATGHFSPACRVSISISEEYLLRIKTDIENGDYLNFNITKTSLFISGLAGRRSATVYDKYHHIDIKVVKSCGKLSEYQKTIARTCLYQINKNPNSWEYSRYKKLIELNKYDLEEGTLLLLYVFSYYINNIKPKDKTIHNSHSKNEIEILKEVFVKYDKFLENNDLDKLDIKLNKDMGKVMSLLEKTLLELKELDKSDLKKEEILNRDRIYLLRKIHTILVYDRSKESIGTGLIKKKQIFLEETRVLDEKRREKEEEDKILVQKKEEEKKIRQDEKEKEIRIKETVEKNKTELKKRLSLLNHQDFYKICMKIEKGCSNEIRMKLSTISDSNCSNCIKDTEIDSMIQKYKLIPFTYFFTIIATEKIKEEEERKRNKNDFETIKQNNKEREEIEREIKEQQEKEEKARKQAVSTLNFKAKNNKELKNRNKGENSKQNYKKKQSKNQQPLRIPKENKNQQSITPDETIIRITEEEREDEIVNRMNNNQTIEPIHTKKDKKEVKVEVIDNSKTRKKIKKQEKKEKKRQEEKENDLLKIEKLKVNLNENDNNLLDWPVEEEADGMNDYLEDHMNKEIENNAEILTKKVSDNLHKIGAFLLK